MISGSGTPRRDWSHRKAWRFCRRTRFYAISLPSSRMESYFLLRAWFGDRECSVPTFSCLSPFLTLFPFFVARFYHQSAANTGSVFTVSRAAFVERNHFLPQETKIYSDPLCPIVDSAPPPSPTTLSPPSLWNEDAGKWSTVSSLHLCLARSNSECARVCVCMCARFSFMCASAAACVSHGHASMEVQRPVSLLPHTGQRVKLRLRPPSTSHKCRAILTQAVLQCPSLRRPDNSRTPAASSLRNATVYPSEAPMHNTHARTHTNKLCRLPIEDMPND